jgi:hypothetical protein
MNKSESITLGSDTFAVSPEQKRSYDRICERYNEIPESISYILCGDGAIGVKFRNIFIGIEQDGHAHS